MQNEDDARRLILPVSFWSPKDRMGLSQLSVFDSLQHFVSHGYSCSYGEFLSYAVFQEQSNDAEYQTFDDLQRQLQTIRGSIENHYGLVDTNLRGTRRDDSGSRKPQSELLGVGTTLALASSAYGLHHP